ncbi:MAG: hypothetical protein KGI54_15320 [Pseudomonadota bacterium]|nr:hypothetical protein [Pseudomonadota bacterium]
MSENRKLADNVMRFLGKASDAYGSIKAEQFSQEEPGEDSEEAEQMRGLCQDQGRGD